MTRKQKDDVFVSEKPEWDTERWPWANWLAQWPDGRWIWYETKPEPNPIPNGLMENCWLNMGGRQALAEYPDDQPHPDWAKSLEERPK